MEGRGGGRQRELRQNLETTHLVPVCGNGTGKGSENALLTGNSGLRQGRKEDMKQALAAFD